ncbi:kelch repeat-containing protein [Piscinibacter sakaiensis]|uniref:Kelch repeat-containing protein n=1 Tax=Piscinibacter sakaiensis TaxID=1547922 RepID=UPI003726BCCE
MLAIGGIGRNSLELWEPATRQWRAVAMTLAHERQFPTATELPDGRVLIAGGLDSAGGPYVFAELFDPRTEVITPLPQAFAPRQFHAAHRCSDGTVLILGGEEVGPVGLRPTAEVLRYDPVALRFGTERPLSQPRTLAATVRLPQDEVLLVGGEVARAEGLASPGVERWSREAGGRAVASLPVGRTWHSASRLLDGRILVVGGEQADGSYVPSALLYE